MKLRGMLKKKMKRYSKLIFEKVDANSISFLFSELFYGNTVKVVFAKNEEDTYMSTNNIKINVESNMLKKEGNTNLLFSDRLFMSEEQSSKVDKFTFENGKRVKFKEEDEYFKYFMNYFIINKEAPKMSLATFRWGK